MNDEDPTETNILDLPNELLLHIFSYLDSVFILDSLQKVCLRFEDLVTDEYLWRYRLGLIFPKAKILVPDIQVKLDNAENPWSRMVYEIERNRKFFTDAKDEFCPRMQTLNLKDVHISNVNGLKLVCNNRLCLSVSRDRTIGVWNVHQSEGAGALVKQIDQAHDGWIWCVDDCDDRSFCTGAWDSNLKVWSFEDFTNISTYRCDSTVLSLCSEGHLIAAGLFNSKLVIYDSRIKEQTSPSLEHTFERKGVIQGVSLEDNLVYAASVNGSVSCYDMRAKQVVKSTTNLCQQIISYSYHKGTIIIGDTMSTLTILNKDLTVQSKSTLEFDNCTKVISIKQNDFDMFVGTRNLLSWFLKADPVVFVDCMPGARHEIAAIEYDFNNVLLYTSDDLGAIVMHKKLNDEYTL